MLICGKNLGNILNIYEHQFCFKMKNYEYCTVNFLTEDSEHSCISSCVLKNLLCNAVYEVIVRILLCLFLPKISHSLKHLKQ